MSFKKRLFIISGCLLALSFIAYVILDLIVADSMHPIVVWISFILFMAHQGASWWVLYRFAMNRQRMSNRLHFMNRVFLGITFGFGLVYIVVIQWFNEGFSEVYQPIITPMMFIMVFGNILYQENNTHNVVNFHISEKTNQSKKTVNQYAGIFTTWLFINFLWLPIGFGSVLSIFSFAYIFLMLVQSSLSYTTYGQSRYWNFTYEVILLLHLSVIGLQQESMLMMIIVGCLSIAFLLRQWIELTYKIRGIIAGVLAFIVVHGVLLMNVFGFSFVDGAFSQLILYPFVQFMIAFVVAYIVNEPLYLQRLLKQ